MYTLLYFTTQLGTVCADHMLLRGIRDFQQGCAATYGHPPCTQGEESVVAYHLRQPKNETPFDSLYAFN